jgi:hypothetical protein
MNSPTGFANIQSMISARNHIPKQRAGAILASATRKASTLAKRVNPHLYKVPMPAPSKSGKKASAIQMASGGAI